MPKGLVFYRTINLGTELLGLTKERLAGWLAVCRQGGREKIKRKNHADKRQVERCEIRGQVPKTRGPSMLRFDPPIRPGGSARLSLSLVTQLDLELASWVLLHKRVLRRGYLSFCFVVQRTVLLQSVPWSEWVACDEPGDPPVTALPCVPGLSRKRANPGAAARGTPVAAARGSTGMWGRSPAVAFAGRLRCEMRDAACH